MVIKLQAVHTPTEVGAFHLDLETSVDCEAVLAKLWLKILTFSQ